MDYYAITHDMTQLGLKGSRLTVYALVYKFSSDGQSEFFGSLSYVSEWCGISRAQATQILHDLTAEGFLIRDDSSGRPHYRVAGVRKTERSEIRTECSEIRTECSEIRTPSDNRSDNRNDNRNIESVLPAREDDGRIAYGVKVRMTRDEYAKIVSRYGADDAAAMVQMLDDYLVDHPRKHYANHYRAAIGWPALRLAEQRTAEQRLKNAQEAGQRAATPQQQYSGYGAVGLAASKRLEELLKQN